MVGWEIIFKPSGLWIKFCVAVQHSVFVADTCACFECSSHT